MSFFNGHLERRVSHRKWDELLPVLRFTDSTSMPALSSDGRMLAFLRRSASLGASGQFYVKLLPDGEQLTHDGRLKLAAAAFSPDGSRIAYNTAGGNLQIWFFLA